MFTSAEAMYEDSKSLVVVVVGKFYILSSAGTFMAALPLAVCKSHWATWCCFLGHDDVRLDLRGLGIPSFEVVNMDVIKNTGVSIVLIAVCLQR